MNKRYQIFIILLLAVFSFTTIYAGGGRRNGTGGASELLIPVGVRGISMGNANSATSYGIESIYWNPAGLSQTDNSVEAMFSYMSHIADIGINYGAVSANIGSLGTVALSLKVLSIGEIAITTSDNPDGTGQFFTPTFLTAGLTYSKNLSDRISVGLTANLITERLAQVSANGFAFDIGIMYENLGNIDGLNFAVVMKNLGPQMTYDGAGLYTNATVSDFNRPSQFYKIEAASFELPSTLEFGFGYKKNINASNSLLLSTSYQNSNFYGDEYKIGGEYVFNNLLALRVGYTLIPKDQIIENIFGITAGAGINYDMGGTQIKFDYAYRQMDIFNPNHVFSVGLGL